MFKNSRQCPSCEAWAISANFCSTCGNAWQDDKKQKRLKFVMKYCLCYWQMACGISCNIDWREYELVKEVQGAVPSKNDTVFLCGEKHKVVDVTHVYDGVTCDYLITLEEDEQISGFAVSERTSKDARLELSRFLQDMFRKHTKKYLGDGWEITPNYYISEEDIKRIKENL